MNHESLGIILFRCFRLIRNIVAVPAVIFAFLGLADVQLSMDLYLAVFSISAFIFFIYSILENRYRHLDALTNESSDRPPTAQRIIIRLLKLTLASEGEQENIAGDLLEEFNEFDSRLVAYVWLYKQVPKSAPPLIYKNIKSRLASYFGERVR